jgi:hypothetical protein
VRLHLLFTNAHSSGVTDRKLKNNARCVLRFRGVIGALKHGRRCVRQDFGKRAQVVCHIGPLGLDVVLQNQIDVCAPPLQRPKLVDADAPLMPMSKLVAKREVIFDPPRPNLPCNCSPL